MQTPSISTQGPALNINHNDHVRITLPTSYSTDEPQCTCAGHSSEGPPLRTYISTIRSRWNKRAHLPCHHTPHVTDTVAKWLRSISLEAYVPHFRANQVTPTVLLTLTSTDLQAIGVNRLADRRKLLYEIKRQAKQPLCNYLTAIPSEHGRIMNHLSGESLFLQWARLSIIMLTFAMASLHLHNHHAPQSTKYVTITAQLLAALSIFVILFALYQFNISMANANDPASLPNAGSAPAVIPTMLIIIIPIVTLYTIMAERSSEAALIILLSL